jgi:alpha-tubulin suppressor-like RCC1 family protein
VLRQQLVAGNVVSFGLADPSGHGDHVDKLRPKCVEALARERVRDVSAGLYHSLVATKDGALLSFGYGSGTTTHAPTTTRLVSPANVIVDGRLGHGDQRTQMIPRPVLSLSGVRIVKVAAGAHHSLVLRYRLFTSGLSHQCVGLKTWGPFQSIWLTLTSTQRPRQRVLVRGRNRREPRARRPDPAVGAQAHF